MTSALIKRENFNTKTNTQKEDFVKTHREKMQSTSTRSIRVLE